jgi:hypothetical protein
MKVTIEIPVRSSSSGETLEQLHETAKREAEGVLRLAYGNLIGLLVEAIKDLAVEVELLKRNAP